MSITDPKIYALITHLQKNNIRIAILQDKIAAQLGVTINETYIMAILFDLGPQTAGYLAKQLMVTPGAITSMTEKLIKKRYIKREYDKSDRRKVLLSIDLLPQEQIAKISVAYSYGLANIFSHINTRHLASLEYFMLEHGRLLESTLKM